LCHGGPDEVVSVYIFVANVYVSGSVVVKALCYKPEGCGFET
jgi:hypothetical protein